MTCETPRSGRLGFVGDYTGSTLDRFRRVRNWTLNSITTPETRIYSGTRFGTQRIGGFTRTSGTFAGFGGEPPLFVGDAFTFIGYTAPDSGVACTEGCAFTLPALVDTLTINWDWTAENRGVNWEIGFSAIGAATTISNFDDPCDDNVYCDTNLCNACVLLYDPCNNNAAVEYCNHVTATLTFTAANVEYSNCSTACQIVKDVGNLDWTLDIVNHNRCASPVKGYDYRIRLMINDTEYWQLEWGHFLGFNNLNVNIETADIISKTDSFAMQAVECCVPATPHRGEILNPAGTTVWPYPTPV